MNLQFVAIRERGTSEILPLSPDTLRVFLILQDASEETQRGLLPAEPFRAREPWVSVRRSRRMWAALPG